MGRIDHQLVLLSTLGSQRGKDLVEHAQPTPADEPIVDRLVRPILARCIALIKVIADQEDNPADDPSIFDPRHSM